MMILLIRRKWLLGSVVFLLTAATVLSFYAKPPAVAALSYIQLPKSEMIILDAGHGGSDGGAVSADGTPESGINLAIAQRLQDFFALMGRETILTRTSAASLADPDSTTLRQEKVSDTKNRVALINSVSGEVLSASTKTHCRDTLRCMAHRCSMARPPPAMYGHGLFRNP